MFGGFRCYLLAETSSSSLSQICQVYRESERDRFKNLNIFDEFLNQTPLMNTANTVMTLKNIGKYQFVRTFCINQRQTIDILILQ